MKASRIIAAAALTSTFLVGAPTAVDAQSRTIDCNATEKVELLNTRIYAHNNGTDSQGKPWQSEMVWDLNPPIAAGEYNAHAVSWDEYQGRSQEAQVDERWYIEFLGEGDKLLTMSEPTADVPDGVDLGEILSDIGTVSFAEPVLAVRTIHNGGGDGSAQSVLMGCLGLDMVSNETPPVDTATNCADQAGFHDVNGECVAIDVTPEPEPEPVPASCTDTAGQHDVNGECVDIAEPEPEPEPVPASCTDTPGQHDVNGECVPIAAAEVEPEVPAECTDTPGQHDVNGKCVPICAEGESLVKGKCEVKAQVLGKVQTKTPAKVAAADTPQNKPKVVAATPEVAVKSSASNPTLPVTGSTTSTALAWAIGVLLAGAAMALSAKAVRGY